MHQKLNRPVPLAGDPTCRSVKIAAATSTSVAPNPAGAGPAGRASQSRVSGQQLLRYRQPGFSSRENETMRSASHPIERLLPVTEIIAPCRFVQWITVDTASPLPRIHLPMDQTEPLSDHDDAFSARRIIMLTRQDLEATRVIYSITSIVGRMWNRSSCRGLRSTQTDAETFPPSGESALGGQQRVVATSGIFRGLGQRKSPEPAPGRLYIGQWRVPPWPVPRR
jgi:hypothetical protein